MNEPLIRPVTFGAVRKGLIYCRQDDPTRVKFKDGETGEVIDLGAYDALSWAGPPGANGLIYIFYLNLPTKNPINAIDGINLLTDTVVYWLHAYSGGSWHRHHLANSKTTSKWFVYEAESGKKYDVTNVTKAIAHTGSVFKPRYNADGSSPGDDGFANTHTATITLRFRPIGKTITFDKTFEVDLPGEDFDTALYFDEVARVLPLSTVFANGTVQAGYDFLIQDIKPNGRAFIGMFDGISAAWEFTLSGDTEATMALSASLVTDSAYQVEHIATMWEVAPPSTGDLDATWLASVTSPGTYDFHHSEKLADLKDEITCPATACYLTSGTQTVIQFKDRREYVVWFHHWRRILATMVDGELVKTFDDTWVPDIPDDEVSYTSRLFHMGETEITARPITVNNKIVVGDRGTDPPLIQCPTTSAFSPWLGDGVCFSPRDGTLLLDPDNEFVFRIAS